MYIKVLFYEKLTQPIPKVEFYIIKLQLALILPMCGYWPLTMCVYCVHVGYINSFIILAGILVEFRYLPVIMYRPQPHVM